MLAWLPARTPPRRVPGRRPRHEDPARRLLPDQAPRDDPRRLRRARARRRPRPDLRLETAELRHRRCATRRALAGLARRRRRRDGRPAPDRPQPRPPLGDRRVDAIAPADVADLVATLAADGKARESIRKSVTALAMVLDFAGVTPNPARDRRDRQAAARGARGAEPAHRRARRGRLPAAPVEAPARAALPRLVRRARLGDRPRRSSATTTSSAGASGCARRRRRRRRALWVELHPALADALEAALGPREDRDLGARLFAGSGADALRTSIAKACKAAGVPLFTPHDLRHRRITLLHLRGMPVGADRRVRRPAQPRRHREHLHARPARRGRARLRGAPRVRPAGESLPRDEPLRVGNGLDPLADPLR